ncbi:DUF4232 domain-containing protein [Streptacidiphilus albus]|uniref:DUF4232 domain-containing protein n=1 Tax=Streptacidiphilus albus TaxID=105425 RepID=UPI0005A6F34E|nr:DUF4232 domain-containing protein [Streptacidiphilus albus]
MRFPHRAVARATVRTAAAAATLVASLGASVALAAPSGAAVVQHPAKPVTSLASCTGATVKVTVRTEPGQRLLLTATNTGRGTCLAYGYPYLGFGDPQAPAGFIAASIPQAVVTLSPGEAAYALVHTTSTGGQYPYTAHTLSIDFANRDQRGSVGPTAHAALPAAGVRVDDTVRTTYWQSTAALALRW